MKASSAEQGMEKACLPGSCLNKIMEGLLVSSMKNVNRGDDECSEDVLIGDEVNFDSFTPLEELELSVRAYNCLKRAGIDSIEVLMLLTDEELSQVRNLGSRSIEEIRGKLIERDAARSGGANPDTASKPVDYAAALEELIGLDNVKKQVRKIAAFARMKQDMQAQGRSDLPAVLNMEFAGNPGTAKTTVARILAGIFHEIGLLSSAEIVEVGRADLVGKYVGHTADRVREVFQRAKGRLLFVDEAYSLLEGQERSFGDEAINTIVQEMENHRAETIVIFAGYPDQMKDFMDRNPGLRSRVPFRICFEDYSAEEMLQITELEASRRGFTIDPAAKERVLELCGAAVGRADAGNGRFCRNLVENAILEYAARVYGDEGASEQKDCVLRAGDFSPSELSATEGTQGKAPRVIGFRV